MSRRVILGMGTGQCGLRLLVEILNRQPGTKVTFEEAPWLPWRCDPAAPGLPERLKRFLETRSEEIVGDVASFYLPHLERALLLFPDLRIICLRRPCEEVVDGFCRALDQTAPVPTTHWSCEPPPGWSLDPFRSHMYPQYDVADRAQGIRRYWDEYQQLSEDLAARYAEQVRIWDTAALTTEAGVREVLSYAGFGEAEQVILTGQRNSPPAATNGHSPIPPARYRHPLDPRRCAILVPFSGFIHAECEEALDELQRRGYQVRRVGGYAAIDQGRNQMATDALRDGFEETLWIDSDVGFHPDSIEKLRSHGHPMVCGIYPQKGKRALACHVMPGTPSTTFGNHGGLVELLYAGTGFLLIRREVYLAVQHKLRLPMCNERFGHSMIPFFQPLIRPIEDGYWYLAEDYAFCNRARECGFRIFADTSIRLWHIGMYRYGWEDAGIERGRFSTFTLNFSDQPRPDGGTPGLNQAGLKDLATECPWPAERPVIPPFPERNWLFPATKSLLTRSVTTKTRLIVELGSWTGRTTRFLADQAPHATLIAVDHWEGSPEHFADPELAPALGRLYEAFLTECWEYRDRIIPLRSKSTAGLHRVAHAGLSPELIYIDADHQFESVRADVTTALDLFPRATLVGDDWNWEGVRKAVEGVCRERRIPCEVQGTAWRILPRP
jgi:hypothetical protein